MTATPTAKHIRDVAWALDGLAKIAVTLLEPIARLDEANAESGTVTVRVTMAGEPITPEDARKLLDWVVGEGMQEELRAWADGIDGGDA